ncbi:hypothetical protein yc1106_05333 [Curvularia clavata]|uniref:Uncharacterized protein n=1 Tax=Curvularia clavata TaxID=95742 RepID=A0A9Q8Z8M5_CURCL|nr:hypothetical protein yc1106_05333 [Curvularia clavata]
MDEPSPDNSEISGFYGPGAWAAWVILLVSSWIPIFLNDYESNTHFIASALYTNWAAIDLLRHLRPLGPGEYLERGDPLEPVIDAPGAVLFIVYCKALSAFSNSAV